MRQNAGSGAGALERTNDVQQVGVVALLAWWRAKGLKAIPFVLLQVEPRAPAFIREGRVGNNVVKSCELSFGFEFRIGQRVALHDFRSRIVVQDHVHPRQTAGCDVFFLSVQRHVRRGLVADFQ